MARRATSKAKKIWSQQANEKQARDRMAGGENTSNMVNPDQDEIELTFQQ